MMFRGKIFLTSITVEDLPWTSENRAYQGSELRPYLLISLDGLEKKRSRCEKDPQVKFSVVNRLLVVTSTSRISSRPLV